jgi:hypothetical protein
MMLKLETPRSTPNVLLPYSLQAQDLPFALRFADRRTIAACHERAIRATQSDGATSGNDGNDPGDNEEFDWINDD